MFADPLSTVSVALPPSWAFDPLSSSLTRLAFLDWTEPRTRRLFVDVGTAFHFGAPEDSDTEWEQIIRNQIKDLLPVDPRQIERRTGPVILVEVPRSELHPGARLAWMRGIRVGVFIEQQGSQPGGALYTPELEEAVRTIDVPANHHIVGQHTKSDWQSEMDATRQADDNATAHHHLERAIAAGRRAWLNSLVSKRAPPDIPAALAHAEATLLIAAIEGSLVRLYHATTTLYRCRVSIRSLPLAGTPVSDRVEELISLALKIHSQLEGSVPIVENGQLVGIVSRANLIQALASMRSPLEVSLSDSKIRDNILAHLRTQPWAHTSLLNITVNDGVVDLWGMTYSDVERKAIRIAAEAAPGVRAVNDHLVGYPKQPEL